MKLNPDCVRDILLCIEMQTNFSIGFRYDSDEPPQALSKYTHEEILYHTKQACYAQLVIGFSPYDDGCYFDVEDLSPKGHEFLANIREDNIWNNIKSIGKKVGSTSLNALTTIASNVISELIKAHFSCGTNP